MKKIVVLFFLSVVIISCKKAEEKDAETYSGDFLYVENAAVLKGANFIYGVNLDEMAKKLAEQVEPIKRDQYDMIPVAVKGTITKKTAGEEGWDEVLTIKEIISVSTTPSEVDIKIEEKKS